MDKSEFWRLIEVAKWEGGGECDEQAQALHTLLSPLPPDEIVAFVRNFDELSDAAYRWDLWGAAYLINGGASDDGFQYFRWWLVGQGQTIYEGALASPDDLADLLGDDLDWAEGDLECEAIAYAPMKTYEQKTGQELIVTRPAGGPGEPAGKRWEEGELDDLYPKIAAKIENATSGQK